MYEVILDGQQRIQDNVQTTVRESTHDITELQWANISQSIATEMASATLTLSTVLTAALTDSNRTLGGVLATMMGDNGSSCLGSSTESYPPSPHSSSSPRRKSKHILTTANPRRTMKTFDASPIEPTLTILLATIVTPRNDMTTPILKAVQHPTSISPAHIALRCDSHPELPLQLQLLHQGTTNTVPGNANVKWSKSCIAVFKDSDRITRSNISLCKFISSRK